MLFYGIADCHGLESFQPGVFDEVMGFRPDSKEVSLMSIRVNANRHRHAVLYQAEISPEICDEISDLLKDGEHIEALQVLKENATKISLMKGPGVEKSWNLIPNPDLDPYRP